MAGFRSNQGASVDHVGTSCFSAFTKLLFGNFIESRVSKAIKCSCKWNADSLKRVTEEARKLGIRVVQSVFEADAPVVWVQRLIKKRIDDNPEKGSKAFIVAIDSDFIILGSTVNLILHAKVEHEYIVGTLLKVSELKPSNHLATQAYSFSDWTLQHWRTFAALLGNDYIRNIHVQARCTWESDQCPMPLQASHL